MPRTMLEVKGSPKISVPTRIAVIGSKTPSTEAFVAPILRVAMASVAVEMIVGSSANPTKLSQSPLVVMPAVIAVSEKAIFPKNYGSRSKKGKILRFELNHNALS